MSIFAAFRKKVDPIQEADPFVEMIPTLAPANNMVHGVNVVRVVQDHGLGQLAEIDADIAKCQEKIQDLQMRRSVVLKLVQVFDPSMS